MKVLTVTPYWFPAGGGLERYAREVAVRLARRGHTVQAVALGPEAARLDDAGVAVDILPWHLRASNTPLRATLALDLARRARDADVIHAHTPVPFAAEMAALASALAGKPLVVTYHAGVLEGAGLAGMAGALDRATFERFMLRRATRLLAVSPFVAERALARHRAKTDLAFPGVVPPRDWPHAPGARRILFVGPVDRAYAWKGLDVLLDALGDVPGASLDVAGTGDRMEEVRARAAYQGLDVRLHGRVDDAGLAALYRGSDVLVLPSTSDAESFGMVLAEAQAHGRPVIAGGGGTLHAFRDGLTGTAVPPGDPAALASALRSLFDDPARATRMGGAARAFAVETFDWERTVEATERALAAAHGGRTRVAPTPRSTVV